MMSIRFGVIAGLAFLVVAGNVVAQPPGNEAGESAVTPDTRTALGLDPAAREGLKQTMREHLEALQAIVAALAQENYEKASSVSHEELGFCEAP